MSRLWIYGAVALAMALCVLLRHPSAAAPSPPGRPARGAPSPELLLAESFDDAQLPARGWYDGSRFTIVAAGAFAGKGCIEYRWNDSNQLVSSRGARHPVRPTGVVYVRFYLKLSPNWGWTNKPYHPHMMHFLTTENDAYRGPATSHLTLYIEPWNGHLRLGATDMQNADAPHGLTQGPLRGGYNGKLYDSKEVLFNDDRWHCVEAMFKLNSVDARAGTRKSDGEVRGWFDDKLVIEHTDVLFRTVDYPKMQINQFLLTPYFGPEVFPHAQALWVDELAVGTQRIGPLSVKDRVVRPATRTPRASGLRAKPPQTDSKKNLAT
jgi:hypothetical protein